MFWRRQGTLGTTISKLARIITPYDKSARVSYPTMALQTEGQGSVEETKRKELKIPLAFPHVHFCLL